MFSERETISLIPGLSEARLQAWVERGWVATVITEKGRIFGDIDVARLRLICTLRDEMEVDQDLLPTVMRLLDQVYDLRRDLRTTWSAIAAEPENIRDRIAARLDPA
ncbi:MAG: helix-turn-helix domain-containing protein [Rhodobacteraceae bacterium]|nr:helix-turn-helix domain-containing protein [Paracoccaceae bacterium]